MDLSSETPKNQENDKRKSVAEQSTDTLCSSSSSCQILEGNDIIDLSKINFDDDETWLYKSTKKSDIDLQKWLYNNDYFQNSLLNDSNKGYIATRTSISFNENCSLGNDTDIIDAGVIINRTFSIDNGSNRDCLDKVFEKAISSENLNVTINEKLNETFVLNSTFQRRRGNRSDLSNFEDTAQDPNETFTIESNRKIDNKLVESIKRPLDRRLSSSMDSIKRSYQTDGINVIVDVQESSLTQIKSSPKTGSNDQMLWPIVDISPINGRNSDPELSFSEKTHSKTAIKNQKSTCNIASKIPSLTSFGKLTRGTVNKSSDLNLRAFQEKKTFEVPKTSNLNSMGQKLKGSYTCLNSVNPNLPEAPPPLDTTVTVQVAQVPKNNNAQFTKSQPKLFTRGIPRPVTGIPRPVSRIPGPRSFRSVSKSAGQ